MRRPVDRSKLFYRVILPVFVVANLALGLFNLSQLGLSSGLSRVEFVGGAFSLVLSGWLAGAWWSRSYWRGVMSRQVRTWHQVVDVLFGWIEEQPVSTDSLHQLKSSIDRSLPN